MPLQYRRQNQGSIVCPVGGGKAVLKLNRGPIYRDLQLRLKMSAAALTAANNTLAKVSRGDEWGIFSDIRLVGGSADVIRQYSGDQLRMRNFFLGQDTLVSHQLGDAVSGTDGTFPAIDRTITIPLWSPDGMQPIDTALDSTRYSELRLELTTAAATAAAGSPVSTNFTATSCQVDVHSYQHEGDSQTDGIYGAGGPFTLRRETAIGAALVSGSDNKIDIPTGPRYRGFLINVRDNATVQKDTGTVCDNIKIVSGSTVFYDRPWQVANEETINSRLTSYSRGGFNRGLIPLTGASYSVNEASTTVTASAVEAGAYPQLWQNQYEIQSGWVFVDFCPDGYFSESLDSNGFGDFSVILHATATGNATIIPIQLFPPRI